MEYTELNRIELSWAELELNNNNNSDSSKRKKIINSHLEWYIHPYSLLSKRWCVHALASHRVSVTLLLLASEQYSNSFIVQKFIIGNNDGAYKSNAQLSPCQDIVSDFIIYLFLLFFFFFYFPFFVLFASSTRSPHHMYAYTFVIWCAKLLISYCYCSCFFYESVWLSHFCLKRKWYNFVHTPKKKQLFGSSKIHKDKNQQNNHLLFFLLYSFYSIYWFFSIIFIFMCAYADRLNDVVNEIFYNRPEYGNYVK